MVTTLASRHRSSSRSPLARFLAEHPGRDLDCRGLRLHYLDEGEGAPVVMLHGNPTWSFFYRGLVEALRPSHRVIVPDQIGCGLSEKPADSRYQYTLASRVHDLEHLLDQLGIQGNLTLILHDWGGMIGMTYAARHPERVARLVVLNTAAFHLPSGLRIPWALRICRTSRLGEVLVRKLNLFARGTSWIGCKRRILPRPIREAYVAPYDSWDHRIAIHRFVQDIPLHPGDPSYDLVSWVEQRLGELRRRPMLIVWGMKDFVFHRGILEEWQRRFPDAEVHRLEDAGHYVLEDDPEAVASLVHRFLASQPRSRAAD